MEEIVRITTEVAKLEVSGKYEQIKKHVQILDDLRDLGHKIDEYLD